MTKYRIERRAGTNENKFKGYVIAMGLES